MMAEAQRERSSAGSLPGWWKSLQDRVDTFLIQHGFNHNPYPSEHLTGLAWEDEKKETMVNAQGQKFRLELVGPPNNLTPSGRTQVQVTPGHDRLILDADVDILDISASYPIVNGLLAFSVLALGGLGPVLPDHQNAGGTIFHPCDGGDRFHDAWPATYLGPEGQLMSCFTGKPVAESIPTKVATIVPPASETPVVVETVVTPAPKETPGGQVWSSVFEGSGGPGVQEAQALVPDPELVSDLVTQGYVIYKDTLSGATGVRMSLENGNSYISAAYPNVFFGEPTAPNTAISSVNGIVEYTNGEKLVVRFPDVVNNWKWVAAGFINEKYTGIYLDPDGKLHFIDTHHFGSKESVALAPDGTYVSPTGGTLDVYKPMGEAVENFIGPSPVEVVLGVDQNIDSWLNSSMEFGDEDKFVNGDGKPWDYIINPLNTDSSAVSLYGVYLGGFRTEDGAIAAIGFLNKKGSRTVRLISLGQTNMEGRELALAISPDDGPIAGSHPAGMINAEDIVDKLSIMVGKAVRLDLQLNFPPGPDYNQISIDMFGSINAYLDVLKHLRQNQELVANAGEPAPRPSLTESDLAEGLPRVIGLFFRESDTPGKSWICDSETVAGLNCD